MAGKKQSTYMYNAKMSMRNLTADLNSSYFSNTKTFASDIKSGYREAVDSKKSSSFNGIKNRIKQTALFKFASDLTKNAFEGLRTGKFYKSDDDLFGFDESAFDFDFGDTNTSGGDFFYDDTGETPQQASSEAPKQYKGDEFTFGAVGKLAKSMSGASKASSNAVINATVEGLFKTAHSINQTIVSANADLKAEIIEQKGYMKGIADTMKEQLGQQQKLVAIQTEMLTEHKALKEMLSDYILPKLNKKDEDNERGIPEWYNAIRKGEMLKAGKSAAGEAFRAIDMEKTQGAFGLAKAMLPMLMMTMGANPFKFFKDIVIEGKLNKWFGLDKVSQKIERMVGSTQDFFNRQFQTMSLSQNGTMRAVGKALMVKPESLDKVATDKYDKSGRVFFDGATREAIVNVIPTYLSSMVSLLSGKERTVYDYNKGVFKTISQTRQEFLDNRPKLDYEYERLAEILKKNMKEDDKKNLDEERFLKLTKYMMTNMARMGYDISTLKNHNYNDAKMHLDFKDEDLSESDFYKLRDLMYKAETNKDTADSFWSINKSTKNYIWDKNNYNVNYAKDARMTGGIAQFNNSYLLDQGAQAFGGSGKKKMGFNYQNPTVGENIVDMSRKDGKVGNIFGTTMSDEELLMTRNYIKDKMGTWMDLIKSNITNGVKELSQTKLFGEKLGLKDSKVFQNLMATSPYDLESIIGHQRKVEAIVSGKLSTEVFNQELDAFNVTQKDKDRIADVLTDPQLSEDERTKKAKDILNHSSEFKKKMEDLKAKFKKKTGIDLDEKIEYIEEKIQEAKDTATDVKAGGTDTSIGEKVDRVKNTIKDYGEKAGEMVKDGAKSAGTKTKEFYEKNKETIWNVSKAAMIGAAGIGIFKTLKKSMVGPIIGMTGLASPIALGAIALGAGIYAYKNNIFDKLFGDNKKAKELRERTGRILKSTLVVGGGIAGISGILSLATPLGFMGPVNAALAGLAISIAGESKGFKRFLFGTEEGSFLSNLKIWLIGDKENGKKGILTRMTEKVTTFFSKGFKSFGRWFKLDIWEPMKSTFKPIKDFISNTATKIFGGLTGIGDKLTGSFTGDFVKPFFAKMKEKVIDPVAGFFKKIFGGIFGFLGKIISAPFKGLRTLITGQTDSSVFTSNYGSSDTQVAEKAEYKANMSAKEKLWNDNKYRSLSDIMADDKLSDKDKKTLRKMYAKEATREAEEKAQKEATQKAVKDDEKDKEGKSGQGIWDNATKYYFDQTKITAKITGAFMGNSTLCGLAALAQAISAVLDSKIEPSTLAQKSFGWIGSRNGVSPEFMLEVCRKFGIGARLMKNPKADTIKKILAKDTIMIVEVDDFETDSLHYLVVRKVEGDTAYYSDPARGKNKAVSIHVLEAKARRAVYLYKKADTSSQVATSAPSVAINKEAEVINTQSMINEAKEVRMNKVVGTVKDLINKVTGKNTASKSGEVLPESEVVNQTPVEKNETFLEKAKRLAKEAKDKVVGAASAVKEKLTVATGRKKMAEYLTGKKSDLYILLKEWKKKYQEDAIRLKETIELQTSSLAYNAEYIKRILVKVHGDIPGFGDKDIKNRHFSRLGNWFKRKWRQAKMLPLMVLSLAYNKFILPIKNFALKMLGGIKAAFIKFPIWLGTKVWRNVIKPMGSMFVGLVKGIWGAFKNVTGFFKDIAVGFVKGVGTVFKAAVKGLIDGITYTITHLKDIFKGIGTLITGAIKGVGHFIKWGVEAIGKTISWTVETIGKGIGWLINRAFDFVGFVGRGILGLFGMKKKAALQEVFVVGGTLDTVRVVEIVKAVGAVDLEYTESMERKMGPSGNIIQKAVQSGKDTWKRLITRRKSPNMKSGDEYAKIDKRQDAETQNAIAVAEGEGKAKEEKKEASWWEKLLGGLLLGFGAWKSGLLGSIIEGLKAGFGGIKDWSKSMFFGDDNDPDKIADENKDPRDKNAFGYGKVGKWLEKKDKWLESGPFGLIGGHINREREKQHAVVSGTHVVSKFLLKQGAKVGATQALYRGGKTVVGGAFAWVKTHFVDAVKQWLKTSKVAKIIFSSKMAEGIIKFFTKFGEKAAKDGAKAATKKGAETTVRTGAYAVPLVGLVVEAIFFIGEFLWGMWDAGDIMGLKSDKVSWSMRFAVGFANAIYGLATTKWFLAWVPFVIPIDWIARNAYYYIFADDSEKAEYDRNHEEWDREMKDLLKKSEKDIKRKKELNDRLSKEMLKVTEGGAMDINDDSGWNFVSNTKTDAQAQAEEVERYKNLVPVVSDEQKAKAQEASKKYKDITKEPGWFSSVTNYFSSENVKKRQEESAQKAKVYREKEDAAYKATAENLVGYGLLNASKLGVRNVAKMANNTSTNTGVSLDNNTAQSVESSQSSIKEYETGASNSYTDALNKSIYGDAAESMRNLNLSAFASNIGRMFGIDLSGNSLSEGGVNADGSMPAGVVDYGKADTSGVKSLMAKYKSYQPQMVQAWNTAKTLFGLNTARDLFRISFSESGWNPTIVNPSQYPAAGLFQVVPSSRTDWGFDSRNDNPINHTPEDQVIRVGNAMMKKMKSYGRDPVYKYMYRALHLPVSVNQDDNWYYYGKNGPRPSWYAANKALDLDGDGFVRNWEVERHGMKKWNAAEASAKLLGFEGFSVGIGDTAKQRLIANPTMGGMMQYGMSKLTENKDAQAGNGPVGYGPIRHVNQTSAKWNKLSMGGLSFKEAGCGPAVMAMLLDKLDIKYNMEELISKAIAMKKGAMGGTPMTYFKQILSEHGVQSAILTASVVKKFITELRAGKSPILLTVSSTGSPHFIIGKEIKNGKLYINDPEKSNSEAITLNDIRLKKAKAILVYKVKGSIKNKIRNMVDTLKGGYGAIKSFVMPKLEGFGSTREVMYNTVERMVQNGAYGPTIINNSNSNTSYDDASKVVKAISKAQSNNKNVTDLLSSIDSNIEKMSKGASNEQIGDGSILSSILTEVKNTNAYLAKLVELMAGVFGKGSNNLVVNGRQVMQTIGGIPQPVTNGISPETVDFYRTVDRIVRGQAL